jgi:hypothetical protein
VYAQLRVVDVEKVQAQVLYVELGVRRGVLWRFYGPVVWGEGHLVYGDTHNAVFATLGICRVVAWNSTCMTFVKS